MDTYSNYFKYNIDCVCGIPAITLTGCVADWQRIRDRIEVLGTYELEWWIERLRPILDEFIQTIQGHPNLEFWQAIYKPKKAYSTEVVTGWIVDLFPYLVDPPDRRRSHVFEWHRENWLPVEGESPETPGSHLTSGKFFPPGVALSDFLKAMSTLPSTLPSRKAYGVGTRSFPSGLSSVPFQLKLRDHSTRKLDLVAGFLGVEQDPEDLAISPVINWCIAEPPPQTPVWVDA